MIKFKVDTEVVNQHNLLKDNKNSSNIFEKFLNMLNNILDSHAFLTKVAQRKLSFQLKP